MSGYDPYLGAMGSFQADQAMLQQRINQLEQMKRQQYQQPYQPVAPVQNVNWIQVAGLEGARNQIVQPGNTAWMMDNNAPVFYVKAVDGMGSATLKAFRFQEVPPESLTEIQTVPNGKDDKYVTREEFNAFLTRLGEKPEERETEHE